MGKERRHRIWGEEENKIKETTKHKKKEIMAWGKQRKQQQGRRIAVQTAKEEVAYL
jgi:hypothetical protein